MKLKITVTKIDKDGKETQVDEVVVDTEYRKLLVTELSALHVGRGLAALVIKE
jgi:hypothetical protein